MLRPPPTSTLFPYTTLFRSSPSQGPTEHLSMWLVDMRAGQQGPPHFYDAEQIWHLLEGDVDIAVDGDHVARSEEHTSELQSLRHLVCRLLLEKKKIKQENVH